MEEHYYNPKNSALKNLGLKSVILTEDRIVEMLRILENFKENIDPNIIEKNITWE